MRAALFAGLLGISTVFAQSAGLTDVEVEAAISAAKEPGWRSLFVEATGPFLADYSLLLQGPVGRTMDLAREAHESYKPLTAAMVPPSVRAREITVAIVEHAGKVPGIKNVVIMPPGATSRDAALQPLARRRQDDFLRGDFSRDAIPRTWRPGFGIDSVRFPQVERFAEDTLPPGDIEIILVTQSGDRRYRVKAQDRDRLR